MIAAFDGSDRAARRRVAWWAIGAAANIAVGIWLATRADRTGDLLTVVSWTRAWVSTGANLYAPEWFVDYPPHAIAALSPLALLPSAAVVPLWVALNIALAVVAPLLAAHLVTREPGRTAVVELTLLFLCWSGTKVFTQYSLVALLFGLGAVVSAPQRPIVGGLCLGLALIKPQIALPFVFALALTARWRSIAAAAGVVAIGWIVFALKAGVGLVQTAAAYLDILRSVYTGVTAQVGASNLQPLFVRLLAPRVADVVAESAAALLAAVMVFAGLAESRRRERALVVCALGGVWSLLTFYHLTYGFVLLLPAAAWLRLSPAFARGSRAELTIFWLLQAFLVIDLPGVGRRLDQWLPPVLDAILANADRGLALLLFAALIWLARRRGLPQTER